MDIYIIIKGSGIVRHGSVRCNAMMNGTMKTLKTAINGS